MTALVVALAISLLLLGVRIFTQRSPLTTPRSTTTSPRPHRARTASPIGSAGTGLTGAELRQILNQQLGTDAQRVSVAIRDRRTGVVVQAGTTEAMVTASIIKVALAITVVEPILGEDEELDPATARLVEAMICSSDNAATQKLFESVGSYALSQTYTKLKLTSTAPRGSWGMSKITSMDQLAIIDALVTPNTVVGPQTQDYILHLMGNIDDDQR
ncbi:MAG: serine hydrolase, partial [Propionibacteriaceae bacterium]